MEGEQYIPSIKSRQPGTVKSASPTKATTTSISESDKSTELGVAKHIGFELSSQLQKKDTGLHLQP
jgi:hypothetical protein